MGFKTDAGVTGHKCWVPDVLWEELAVEAVRRKTDPSHLIIEMLAERYPEAAREVEGMIAAPHIGRRPGSQVAARAGREMAREMAHESGTGRAA